MLGIQDLPLFILSGLLLNLIPGPDSLLVIAHTARQGTWAGMVAAVGIAAGVCVHVLAAALGLSALLATSSTAFVVVKWLGAAYLLYLGLQLLFSVPQLRNTHAASLSAHTVPLRNIFLQGFVTNTLNPKVALFFLAFVPQFIDPAYTQKAVAFLVLGGVFNLNSLLWSLVLVGGTAKARQRARCSQALLVWLNRLAGMLFIGFAVRLVLAKHPSS